jgi:hypothetical protein
MVAGGGAIEVKLGEDKVAEGAAALNWLEEMVTANPMQRAAQPSFKMVLVGNAPYARRTDGGVLVVPLNCLTAQPTAQSSYHSEIRQHDLPCASAFHHSKKRRLLLSF